MKAVRVGLGLCVCAGAAFANVAHAQDDDGAPKVDPAATIPVRIEAGGDIVSIDELRCMRGTCEGRVTPGRHTVKREVIKDDGFVTDHSEEIEINGPTVVHVQGPGFLRRTAVVTVVAGTAIVLAGVILPLILCKTNETVDPVTGIVRRDDPCTDLSDGVKIAWIGGVGIGLTLATLGLIGYATTSGDSHVAARRWALLPLIAPTRREGHVAPMLGLGLGATF